jgi:hypothetical protein
LLPGEFKTYCPDIEMQSPDAEAETGERGAKKPKKPPPPANERLPPQLSKQIDKRFGDTIAAAQTARATADEAEKWRQRAAKAENDAERLKAQLEASDLEKRAEQQIKIAKRLESGAWQGAGAGAGIGAATGMGVGTVVGAIVGGVTAIPTTLLGGVIGAGTGAIHGPWVSWTGSEGAQQLEALKEKVQDQGLGGEKMDLDEPDVQGMQRKESAQADREGSEEVHADETMAEGDNSHGRAVEKDGGKTGEILKTVVGHGANASQNVHRGGGTDGPADEEEMQEINNTQPEATETPRRTPRELRRKEVNEVSEAEEPKNIVEEQKHLESKKKMVTQKRSKVEDDNSTGNNELEKPAQEEPKPTPKRTPRKLRRKEVEEVSPEQDSESTSSKEATEHPQSKDEPDAQQPRGSQAAKLPVKAVEDVPAETRQVKTVPSKPQEASQGSSENLTNDVPTEDSAGQGSETAPPKRKQPRKLRRDAGLRSKAKQPAQDSSASTDR